ncbi:MAG: universal stress protein [Deltaproteobacteria bacterium]|nr:universal stress protein [Deltaproteobacteria bacterium]
MAKVIFSHLRKLLVCTDGSPASEGAVNAGVQLGILTEAKICLLRVINIPLDYESIPVIPQLLPALEEQAQNRLRKYQEEAAATGVSLEGVVRNSISVPYGILDEAGARKPDWIIMGRKGLSGIGRLLMGSVTIRVIGSSPCHVLVVPREAKLRFKKILIAHDGSVFGEGAWRQTIMLAKRAGSEVIAVSVARDESLKLECQMLLQHLEASAARHNIRLQPLLPQGRPFEQIIQSAQDEKVDLIVLGSHGRSGLARLFMGSVAERVIGTVKCPVLVTKIQEAEAAI